MTGIPWNMIISIAFGLAAVVLIGLIWNAFWLWWQSVLSNATVGLFQIIFMRFRKVSPSVIVTVRITAKKAGIDISAERPDLRLQCVLASIVPDVAGAVEEAMYYFSVGGSPSAITYDLARGGVTVTDEWRLSPTKRVDTNEFYDAAELAVITQQANPCPDGCGVVIGEPESETDAG